MYNRKDHYYKKAKEEGFASRAVYKLEQIQKKFHVIKIGDRVLDLGAAPGGWMQAVSEWVGPQGLVVGIDLLPLKIPLKPNMRFVQGDVNDASTLEKIAGQLPAAGQCSLATDVVLSDMAPNTSGVAFKDAYLSYELCMMALDVAKKLLKPGGCLVAKIFQGDEVEGFKKELRACFKKVGHYVPPATREGSKELYLVAAKFNIQA
jgi:23S rRNA (uridine2552-2'-O)-methyltransferase